MNDFIYNNDYIKFAFDNKEILIFIVIILFLTFNTLKKLKYYDNVYDVLRPMYSSISTILAIFLLMCFYNNIDILYSNILDSINRADLLQNGYFHALFIALIFCVIKIVFQIIFRAFNDMLSVVSLFNNIKESKFKSFIYSLIIGCARGSIFIILLYVIIALSNISFSNGKQYKFLGDFKLYTKVYNLIAENDIKSIGNGLSISDTLEHIENAARLNEKTVYYNGVTINDGVKSNNNINNKAREITKRAESNMEKAKKIYVWIGTNIKYDYEKAENVILGNDNIKSGAIVAFENRKGICFDYACLYTAMAKEVGLKTRVVVGEAFNGKEFISHSWNEVYIEDESRWVKVDCTFYSGGNYFDNDDFDNDHINSEVIGEF